MSTIKTLIELVQDVDAGRHPAYEIHPAWRAIVDLRRRVVGVQCWGPGAVRRPGNAWDWEIALSMIVRGYGADVIALPEIDGWRRYLLPPLLVIIDEEPEETLAVDSRINPLDMLAYYQRTRMQQLAAGNYEEWT